MFEITDKLKNYLKGEIKTRADVHRIVADYFDCFSNHQDYSDFWDFCMECAIKNREEKNMKKITIIRGGQEKPLNCKNDSFDSTMEILSADGRSLRKVPYVNTDFCFGYNGGILAEGLYSGIAGVRTDNGKKVIFLFDKKYSDQVNKKDDLTERMRVLPSLIPNQNQGGRKEISQVLIHCDGYEGGWSHGCQTVYPDYWDKTIALFSLDEKIEVEIIRAQGWKAPDYYLGA